MGDNKNQTPGAQEEGLSIQVVTQQGTILMFFKLGKCPTEIPEEDEKEKD